MENYFPKVSKGSVITFVRKDTGDRHEGTYYEFKQCGLVGLKYVSVWTKDEKSDLNPKEIWYFPVTDILELEVIKRKNKANTNQDGNNKDGSSSRSMDPPSE